MNNALYPELDQFLGGYFHEDFDTYAATWEGVVDFYAAETSLERRQRAVFELNSLLSTADDVELARVLLRDLGVSYDPKPASDREWLVDVRDRLAGTI